MKVLKKIPYTQNSDNWIFDSEIIFQILNASFKIKEVPIPTTYSGPISSISFFAGVVYGLSIFWLIIKFKLHQWNIIQQKQFIWWVLRKGHSWPGDKIFLTSLAHYVDR